MNIFEQQLMSGDLSPDSAYLYAYGEYLSRGGTRDGFMDLTMDEIQLIYTVSAARQAKQTKDILVGMAKILGKMFGAEE